MTLKKMSYPGSVGWNDVVAEAEMRLVEESSPGRIRINGKGVRGGTYAMSTDMDGAVDLIFELEAAVKKAAGEGFAFTHPAFVRLCEHRMKARQERTDG